VLLLLLLFFFILKFGEKSSQGRGGMQAKINAALKAVKGGVQNVVIAFGHDPFAIERVCCGEQFGTLFCADPENLPLVRP
jgi:delta-1-pyrroline-5-carboxylate synthetase